MKIVLFLYLKSIFEVNRPDPARPWRSFTAYFSNLLEDTNLKLLHNIVTGIKIVVINFDKAIFNDSEG